LVRGRSKLICFTISSLGRHAAKEQKIIFVIFTIFQSYQGPNNIRASWRFGGSSKIAKRVAGNGEEFPDGFEASLGSTNDGYSVKKNVGIPCIFLIYVFKQFIFFRQIMVFLFLFLSLKTIKPLIFELAQIVASY